MKSANEIYNKVVGKAVDLSPLECNLTEDGYRNTSTFTLIHYKSKL